MFDRHLGEHAGRRRSTAGTRDRQGRSASSMLCVTKKRRDRPARRRIRRVRRAVCRQRGIERDERFVEDKQFGLDRKRPRQSDAAREAERQFARIMAAMLGEAERRRTARSTRRHSLAARRAAHSPRRCARAAAAAPETRRRACRAPAADAAFKIAIQPDNDAQERGLAAAGRADQRRDFAVRQGERDLAEHMQTAARCGAIGLSLDVNSSRLESPAGDMSFKRLHQETFRWRA